jgi:hypothetical protein
MSTAMSTAMTARTPSAAKSLWLCVSKLHGDERAAAG